jgi:exopolysaccharide biosynthesis polyprenyl glycosylphosphotransferase
VSDLLGDPRLEAIAFQFPNPALSEADVHSLLHRGCQGLEVSDIVTLYKATTGKVPLSYLDHRWLLSHMGIQGGASPFYLKVKRVMDFAVGALGLALTSPLMALIALLIQLDSKGPVLFRQERLGRYRRGFQCLKFRTMVDQAEEETGPVWSSLEDPRLTSVGRWLRRLRLDELPQLINVLRGDMSLIGPRPIRAHFADQLSERIPLYELRFSLRPGLTGWAQVNQGYANTESSQVEKFEYDLFYIQNVSMLIDSMILIKTFRTLFEHKGQ